MLYQLMEIDAYGAKEITWVHKAQRIPGVGETIDRMYQVVKIDTQLTGWGDQQREESIVVYVEKV